MNFRIEQISSESELLLFLPVIQKSFKTVADELGFNETNAPTNPAFTTREKLSELMSKSECFGMYEGDEPAGFFALEYPADKPELYIERLCVMPEKRHNGYGRTALCLAADSARERGCERISIGIINENRVLKKWYIDFGFTETSVRKFEHLPFEVCFLEFRPGKA